MAQGLSRFPLWLSSGMASPCTRHRGQTYLGPKKDILRGGSEQMVYYPRLPRTAGLKGAGRRAGIQIWLRQTTGAPKSSVRAW